MTNKQSDPSSISKAIATRLKHYRKQQKLSLDELSRKSTVSKGMLVEIEACRANPSIAILCKLATTMGVAVADFVEIAATPSVNIIADSAMPILWAGDKGGNAKLLAGTSGAEMVELWQWQLYPGEHYDSSGHSPGTTELLYIQQGYLDLTIAGASYSIAAGESVVVKTDVAHSYKNLNDCLLTFTMAVHEKVVCMSKALA